MIEIGVLIFLCTRMRNLLYERGWDRTFWMQLLVVVVWLGSEFTGALIYGVVVALRDGEAALENLGFMAYPPALITAILGQLLLFWIVKSKTGKSQETPEAVAAIAPLVGSETSLFAVDDPLASFEPVMPAVPRHSRLGVASFALACLSGVSMFVLFVIVGYMETTQPGAMDDETAAPMIVGLFSIGLVLLSLVALGIGVGGLFQKGKRKLFAVLGTVISTLTVAGVNLVVFLP